MRVCGLHGRVVSDLPSYAKAPYRRLVIAETISVNAHYVEVPLLCPGFGDRVKGCLLGYAPPLHAMSMPKPVLPFRGVDRASLEATLR